MRSCKCVLHHVYEWVILHKLGVRSPRKEVTKVDKLAVRLVLDVDNAPARLASADGLAIDDHSALGANDGERNHALYDVPLEPPRV